MTQTITQQHQFNIAQIQDVANILLADGLAGVFRYGDKDVLRAAMNITPEPVEMDPLIEQALSLQITRIFQTRIHKDNFNYDRRTKWNYWAILERVQRVVLVDRIFYRCCSKPIPMLFLVKEYPQDVLGKYHNMLASLIDVGSPLYRRKTTDELLGFIIPASASILRMDELVYLYTKLLDWQVNG